jgi:hypothetical protein
MKRPQYPQKTQKFALAISPRQIVRLAGDPRPPSRSNDEFVTV